MSQISCVLLAPEVGSKHSPSHATVDWSNNGPGCSITLTRQNSMYGYVLLGYLCMCLRLSILRDYEHFCIVALPSCCQRPTIRMWIHAAMKQFFVVLFAFMTAAKNVLTSRTACAEWTESHQAKILLIEEQILDKREGPHYHTYFFNAHFIDLHEFSCLGRAIKLKSSS